MGVSHGREWACVSSMIDNTFSCVSACNATKCAIWDVRMQDHRKQIRKSQGRVVSCNSPRKATERNNPTEQALLSPKAHPPSSPVHTTHLVMQSGCVQCLERPGQSEHRERERERERERRRRRRQTHSSTWASSERTAVLAELKET